MSDDSSGYADPIGILIRIHMLMTHMKNGRSSSKERAVSLRTKARRARPEPPLGIPRHGLDDQASIYQAATLRIRNAPERKDNTCCELIMNLGHMC